MKRLVLGVLLLLPCVVLAGKLEVLKEELANDPLGRGYSAMTVGQVVVDLNTAYRDRWIALSASQVFEAIDSAEFVALTAAQQQRVDRILGLGNDIQTAPGSKARDELVAIFGATSKTILNLLSVANPKQTRAQELGVGYVGEGTIAQTKVLP